MRRYQLRLWFERNIWYWLKCFGLFFYPRACNWHKGMEPENWNESPPSCPDCGCLLDTKLCPRCGKDFLDFGGNSFDDVMASPTVTSPGDLTCIRCAGRYEDDEYDPDSDFGDYDPYEDTPISKSEFERDIAEANK